MTDPSAHPSDIETSAATMRATLIAVGVSGLLIAGASYALFDAISALGAAIGGALATANLWVLGRVTRAFVAQKHAAPWAVIAAVKLIALFIGVWIILKSGVIPPLALAFGYAALPIGITIGSLLGPKPADLPSDDAGPSDPPAGA